MAARLVDDLAELFLGMAIKIDQLLVGVGLLDRVQILALDILDQRELGRRRIVDVADDRRDRVELRALRRAPAPLAGDDLEAVAVGPQQDRLKHAALGDRFGELVERLFVELHPRLARVGPDPRDFDLANAFGRLASPPASAPLRREAPTGPCPSPLAGRSALMRPPPAGASRPISSRASRI